MKANDIDFRTKKNLRGCPKRKTLQVITKQDNDKQISQTEKPISSQTHKMRVQTGMLMAVTCSHTCTIYVRRMNMYVNAEARIV